MATIHTAAGGEPSNRSDCNLSRGEVASSPDYNDDEVDDDEYDEDEVVDDDDEDDNEFDMMSAEDASSSVDASKIKLKRPPPGSNIANMTKLIEGQVTHIAPFVYHCGSCMRSKKGLLVGFIYGQFAWFAAH